MTFKPAPIGRQDSELAEGEKPEKDRPEGCEAWILELFPFTRESDLPLLIKRPTDNPYYNHQFQYAINLDEHLSAQNIYVKVFRSNVAMKAISKHVPGIPIRRQDFVIKPRLRS